MDEQLISKKDLLALTAISYGQLYRWKRKGLIPEDWFIKKSSYTGQETFFPKGRVLARIAKIQNMKEDVSLDDMADVFSPKADTQAMDGDDMVARGIVSAAALDIYMKDTGSTVPLGFADMVHAYLFGKMLESGDLALPEARQMLDVLRTAEIKNGDAPIALMLARKLGVFVCVALSPPADICHDRDMRLIANVSMPAVIEELKCKLAEGGKS